MDKTAIAKQICKNLGIEWDEQQSIPCLNDTPVSKEMVLDAFNAKEPAYQTFRAISLNYNNIDPPEYNTNKLIALAS